MSYKNLVGASNRIKKVMESNWKVYPCIHFCLEALLCAKHNSKPRRGRMRNQLMDATLVKLLTQKQ